MKERPNKSQLKREANALYELGEALAKLSPTQLSTLALPDDLAEALFEAKRIRSHGAHKRQLQYTAGILRSLEQEEVEAIQAGLAAMMQSAHLASEQFHIIESWRDRFLSDDADVLTEFLHQYPCDDIQKLRQTIKAAKKEKADQKNLGGAKSLFKLLKQIIEAA